ncbi:MAG: hypothetical protein NVS1B14_00670 [Vulcanimicrobiaceae bacterium]
MTQGQTTNGVSGPDTPLDGQARSDISPAKVLVWVGIAGLSAALAFTVARAYIKRQPADPTSRRIQQLIDEANQLLRTLDEQRNSSP